MVAPVEIGRHRFHLLATETTQFVRIGRGAFGNNWHEPAIAHLTRGGRQITSEDWHAWTTGASSVPDWVQSAFLAVRSSVYDEHFRVNDFQTGGLAAGVSFQYNRVHYLVSFQNRVAACEHLKRLVPTDSVLDFVLMIVDEFIVRRTN